MAKDGDTGEPLIEFFKTANINAVHKVLERARKNADREANRQASAARKVGSRALTKAMNRAMGAYGRSVKNRASIRQTAPDTGGRPYHFGYSTVTRGEKAGGRKTPSKASKASPTAKAPGGGKGRPEARTREAAHQVYTERDGAIEPDATEIGDPSLRPGPQGQERDSTGIEEGREATGPDRQPGADRDPTEAERPFEASREQAAAGRKAGRDATTTHAWVEATMDEGPELSPGSTAAAAQAYIEDPAKVSHLMGTTASFGTIGETLQERMAFWDLVHDHERPNGGRTQSRLVLELPHEASARDRHEIVRRFTNDLAAKGIPFWASIHVPSGENDKRNHHAHVVLTDRPMRRMRHPETGDVVWDFTVAETYKTSSRHTVTRYPFRQHRDPEMRQRGWVKSSRARFSRVVNEVMTESGNAVRYDPRSYKDMGLQVAPMRNVHRILADKIGKRSFVVMDAEWTRKMVDAEIAAAALRRDATFVKLQGTELAMQRAAREAQAAARANTRLPKHMRLSPGRVIARAAAAKTMDAILAVRRERLATRLADEATLSALRHVADATSPEQGAKRPLRAYDPATAPDPAALAALHTAALEEMAAHAASTRTKSSRLHAREEVLTREWKGGQATPPGPASGTRQNTSHGPSAETPTPSSVIRMPGPTGNWTSSDLTRPTIPVIDDDAPNRLREPGRPRAIGRPPSFTPGSMAAMIDASARRHVRTLLETVADHAGPPGEAIKQAYEALMAAATSRRQPTLTPPIPQPAATPAPTVAPIPTPPSAAAPAPGPIVRPTPTSAGPDPSKRLAEGGGYLKAPPSVAAPSTGHDGTRPERSEVVRLLGRKNRAVTSDAAVAARAIAAGRTPSAQTPLGPAPGRAREPKADARQAMPGPAASADTSRRSTEQKAEAPPRDRDGRARISEGSMVRTPSHEQGPALERGELPRDKEAPATSDSSTDRVPPPTDVPDEEAGQDDEAAAARRKRRKAILARRRNARGMGF